MTPDLPSTKAGPFTENPGVSRFDPIREVSLSLSEAKGEVVAELKCSNPLGMLLIAEHVATTEFAAQSRRDHTGGSGLARRISTGETSVVAYVTKGALIIRRVSLLPSFLRRERRKHNQLIEALAKACKAFAETKELPAFRGLSEAATAIPDESGWVKCPQCGRQFALRSEQSWNGDRHMTCGKRLTIERL